MSNFKFELNKSGVKELMHDRFVVNACEEQAKRILRACPVEGYELEKRNYPDRSGYVVVAAKQPAIQDNKENDTLLKVRGW